MIQTIQHMFDGLFLLYILLIVYFIIFVNEVLLTISKFGKKYLNIFLYQWTQKKIIKLYLKKKHFKP
jgi:hypothetical protein